MFILQWKKCGLVFGSGLATLFLFVWFFSRNTSNTEENICNCFRCSKPFQVLRRTTLRSPLQLLPWSLPRFLWLFQLVCLMCVFSQNAFLHFSFSLYLTETYCSFSRMVFLSPAITVACALFLTPSIKFY